MKKHKVFIIVGVDEKNGIGLNGKLAWHFKSDMEHFKKITTQTTDPNKKNMVVMGRNTWDSLPEKYKPLKGRINAVLSRNSEYKIKDVLIFNSLQQAVDFDRDDIENIFIIGGANVYKDAVENIRLDGLYVTQIDNTFDCDVYFPEYKNTYPIKLKLGETLENGIKLNFYLFNS